LLPQENTEQSPSCNGQRFGDRITSGALCIIPNWYFCDSIWHAMKVVTPPTGSCCDAQVRLTAAQKPPNNPAWPNQRPFDESRATPRRAATSININFRTPIQRNREALPETSTSITFRLIERKCFRSEFSWARMRLRNGVRQRDARLRVLRNTQRPRCGCFKRLMKARSFRLPVRLWLWMNRTSMLCSSGWIYRLWGWRIFGFVRCLVRSNFWACATRKERRQECLRHLRLSPARC